MRKEKQNEIKQQQETMNRAKEAELRQQEEALRREREEAILAKDNVIQQKNAEIQREKEGNTRLTLETEKLKDDMRRHLQYLPLSELKPQFSDQDRIKIEGNKIIHHEEQNWEICSIGDPISEV